MKESPVAGPLTPMELSNCLGHTLVSLHFPLITVLSSESFLSITVSFPLHIFNPFVCDIIPVRCPLVYTNWWFLQAALSVSTSSLLKSCSSKCLDAHKHFRYIIIILIPSLTCKGRVLNIVVIRRIEHKPQQSTDLEIVALEEVFYNVYETAENIGRYILQRETLQWLMI